MRHAYMLYFLKTRSIVSSILSFASDALARFGMSALGHPVLANQYELRPLSTGFPDIHLFYSASKDHRSISSSPLPTRNT